MTPQAKTGSSEDLKAVLDAVRQKRPVDPAVAERIRRRSDKIIERLRQQPPTNIAVDLIREVRDE